MVGWVSVLKLVPWSDVIANAPKVADAARKLWKTASKNPPEAPLPEVAAVPPGASPEAYLAELEARLSATEGAVVELHDQMLASAKLIETLAEQNTQLVQRIEANRVRVRWLTAATVVLAIVAIAALWPHIVR